MRELSDSSCRDQASAYIAWASRRPASVDGFDRWARSKDLGRDDRMAIQEQVAYLLMAGER